MKTVLVTGANRGLGLGFADHYLEAGCRVFASARNPGTEEFAELSAKHGERFVPVELDVGDAASVDRLASTLADIEIDLVINNAGTSADEPFGQWTCDTFARVMAINAIGPALVAQALLPLMKSGSKLVNLSSGLASKGLNINPETGLDAYAASKAALNMVSRRLASKLEPEGIVVVAFDPGWVKTRMGGEGAELTIDESISAMTATIESLGPADCGRFLNREGEEIPW